MTVALSGEELAVKLEPRFPSSIIKAGKDSLLIKGESLVTLASYLKTEPGLEFDFLSIVTAVDYKEYFELVYYFTSTKNNHSLVLKVRCDDRNNATVPSLTGLWQGADFQEREVFDLFGIKFEEHPQLKRIFLWEGFEGHPLRKDYVNGA